MYEVVIDKKKTSRTYFRLLFGMSLFECIESIAIFCGPWCTPSSWSNTWWSGTNIGNMTTCKLQAVMIQSSTTGSSLYSGVLALYYVLAIRYNVLERIIRHKYEPYMHLMTWLLSIGTAIAIVPLDLIKPLGTICWIGRTPGNCLQSYQSHNNGQQSTTTCTQGDNAQLYQLLFYYIWFYGSFVFIAGSMISVWIKIRIQENRISRFNSTMMYQRQSQKFIHSHNSQESCCNNNSSEFLGTTTATMTIEQQQQQQKQQDQQQHTTTTACTNNGNQQRRLPSRSPLPCRLRVPCRLHWV